MKNTLAILFFSLLAFPFQGSTQVREMDVDESAEVFLDDYSDVFQENFFEALKQKGIENYDKAINLLLECKLIDATNTVVDHELAKVYLEEKQYAVAQDYAIAALVSEPENLWYLNTLVTAIEMQGSSLDQMDINIPLENDKLKENLALIYFRQKNFQKALAILSGTRNSQFTKDLSAKIKDSIDKEAVREHREDVVVEKEPSTNPIEEFKVRLADLMVTKEYTKLAELSGEAMEDYPAQPYFYYVNGYALNRTGHYTGAIEVLEAALDYMLDDVPLVNKIYQELVDAHTAMNNSSKANMYLRMIKPGF